MHNYSKQIILRESPFDCYKTRYIKLYEFLYHDSSSSYVLKVLKIILKWLFPFYNRRFKHTSYFMYNDQKINFSANNTQFCAIYLNDYSQGYELELTSFIDVLLEHNNYYSFIDIGTNWGYYPLTLLANSSCKGKIYTFEASREVFIEHKKILQDAGLEGKVIPFNVAIGSKTGFCSTAIPDGLHSGETKVSRYSDTSFDSSVKMKPLSHFNVEPDNTIIKIDAEGFEYDIIKASSDILLTKKPVLIFENWKFENNSNDVLELLTNHHYNLYLPVFEINNVLINQGEYKYFNLKNINNIKLVLKQVLWSERQLYSNHLNFVAVHNDSMNVIKRVFT